LKHPGKYGTSARLNRRTDLRYDNGVVVLKAGLGDVDGTFDLVGVELDAPRHLHVHTEASMRFLARQSGLDLVAVRHEAWAAELWASEQYRRGIPLTDARSHAPGGRGRRHDRAISGGQLEKGPQQRKPLGPFSMPGAGLEPARACARAILSRVRLPISPPRPMCPNRG
jgi:hypothetical protein